jgi:hypothetical protein
MGEIKDASEGIVRAIKEVFDELGKQREKLGSLMVIVNNFSNKVERIEAENVQLKKQLEEQAKDLDKVTKEKNALEKQQK